MRESARRLAAGAGPRAARWLALGALVAGVAGCSAGYVARAAFEEARILWRREPIEKLLARPGIGNDTKRKLQMVLEVREFAAQRIGLRVAGSYSSVSTVDGRAVVQLLTASRRDRLEPYTWWFPVVGRVPYKGFFSKKTAAATVAELDRKGYDTFVRPAIAFSTLGWFDDPLPSTLLKHDEITLAQVIFHELLHNTVFLPGETAFDESTATFTGYRGAIEFFCEGERSVSDQCRAATADWQDTLTISKFFTKSVTELEAFYATKPNPKALEEGRKRAFAQIREQFQALKLHPGRYANFAAGPINNANLLQERIYLRDLDVFDEIYREEGSLRAAVETIRGAVGRGGNPFDRVREALAASRTQVAGRRAD